MQEVKTMRKVFFNHEKVRIINDDVLLTNEIPKDSVDLIVTSPLQC